MAQGGAERRGGGGDRAEAPSDVGSGELQQRQNENTNAATSTISRNGGIRHRDDDSLANPFRDSDDESSRGPAAAAAGEHEDNTNDDSWSSTSTRRPRARMEAAIMCAPGTPGAAIDPQRASAPRRAAFAPSSAVKNPLRSLDRPHANSRSFAGAAGFQLAAPPRLPEPTHTAPQRERYISDTHQRGRGTVVAGLGGDRDDSRSTMATVVSLAGTSLPYTTAPTSRQTTATARSGGDSLADLSLTSPFPSADAGADASFSPAHGRNDSVQGTEDGKTGPNDKGLKGLREKKSMKDMFGSLSRAFGRKATRPTGGERDGVRKSSGLTSLFAGKRRHALPSTELKPFPTDSQLNLALRSPPIAIAVGGGARGLALPSGGMGSGMGSYRATPVGPSPFVSPGHVFAFSGGQRPDPYANKPLPPSPPKEEETPKGKGKGKGKEGRRK